MANNRDLQRRDLSIIERDWWIPIILTSPSGVNYTLKGDVRHEKNDFDPDTGAPIVLKFVSVTVRKSELTVTPKDNEQWFISYASTLLEDGTINRKVMITPNNASNDGESQGWIKFLPQDIS